MPQQFAAYTGPFSVDWEAMESFTRSGTRRKTPLPRIGQRFGELTVQGYIQGVRGGVGHILVQCSCGNPPHRVSDANLRKGASTRCNPCARIQTGHWKKKYSQYADVVPNDIHRERLLNRISAIINRCENPSSKSYRDYGGRGIRVFPAWLDGYPNGRRIGSVGRRYFLQYLLTLPGWDNAILELDRVDNNKGYEPDNLRFVTRLVNMSNRRQLWELELRIADLQARLRHCKCGAETAVYSVD